MRGKAGAGLGLCFWLASGALIAQTTATAPAKGGGTAAWRQWGGPNRNFVVDAKGLSDKWPDAGPPLL